MNGKNFTLRTGVKFSGNSGDFDKQPFINLVEEDSITSGKFLSLYRIRRSKEESSDIDYEHQNPEKDGVIGLSYGDGSSVFSSSGTYITKAISLNEYNENLVGNTTTADAQEYFVNVTVDDNSKLTLMIDDNGTFHGDIVVENLTLNSYNYIGSTYRPQPEGLLDANLNQTILPNGSSADSTLVLQYQYNAMEKTDVFLTSGLTAVYDWSGNSNTGSIFGTAVGDMANFGSDNSVSAGVTGWTAGIVEGGFRLDGASYIESETSTLFTAGEPSDNGYTLLTSAKFFTTADTDILTLTDGVETYGSLKIRNGSFVFDVDTDSITAGSITAVDQIAATGSVELGKWYNIAATLKETNGVDRGSKLYINGEPSILTRTVSDTLSASMFTVPTVVAADTKLIIGTDIAKTSNFMNGVISLTRVFNRPLNDAQIFENFITSIPSQIVCSEINIA